MPPPASLTDGHLAPLWEVVRLRLERAGCDNRGRVTVPDLGPAGRLAVDALAGPSGKTVSLLTIEDRLRALGVGSDLPSALAALGHPVSSAPGERRQARREAVDARAAARAGASAWIEPWAGTWIDEVIARRILAGLDADEALSVVGSVRAVLDRLASEEPGEPISRTDLAAQVLGSSHALDPGTRVEAAATRALHHAVGAVAPRDLWERAGAHLDLVSAPALTWNLPANSGSPLAGIFAEAKRVGIPVHLTQLALRKAPVVVASRTVVLVVENPRVVEAAAQQGTDLTVVATNGNPSNAVRLLLDQLLGCEAQVRYHGDFDAAGLAICARMQRRGLLPWRMTASDYLAALAEAAQAGVRLPADSHASPPTPWDPELRDAFDHHRSIIHEERLITALLDASTTGLLT